MIIKCLLNIMWFHKNDLKFHQSVADKSIRGYVLPHAGTKYTGKIISHTLRFKPTYKFKKVVIIYYPVSDKPNVHNRYYHEYYVPMKSIKHFIDNKWNMKKVSYVGINLRSDINKLDITDITDTVDTTDSLIIVSADFSHFLPFKHAMELENKAAMSMMFKKYNKTEYTHIIDHIISFKFLNRIIPYEWYLQWIGRTRSPGKKGVGYLSFFIKEPIPLMKPDGIFVTCYDNTMVARECLGEWFTHHHWTKHTENNLIKKVIHLGTTTSRLTGISSDLPVTYYTVTYLYSDNKKFIRGYHGIKHNAFYLPNVMLEHTHSNGKWTDSNDNEWLDGKFMLHHTLDKLTQKAGKATSGNYTLYRSEVRHFKI